MMKYPSPPHFYPTHTSNIPAAMAAEVIIMRVCVCACVDVSLRVSRMAREPGPWSEDRGPLKTFDFWQKCQYFTWTLSPFDLHYKNITKTAKGFTESIKCIHPM